MPIWLNSAPGRQGGDIWPVNYGRLISENGVPIASPYIAYMQKRNRANRQYGNRWIWLLSLISAAAPAVAQEPVPATRYGFSVREATAYSSYYSLGLPPSLIGSGSPLLETGYDVAIGGAAVLAFDKPGERTTFSIQYTPSYTRRVRYSDWSAFSNSTTIQLDHLINSRLRFAISAVGAILNREEFQFGDISPVSSVPNSSFAGSLLNEGVGDPAAQYLFFGSRILTANVHTGLRYALSPRLLLRGGVAGSRTQYLRSRIDDNSAQPARLIPQVTSFIGDLGATYQITPRTAIGGRFDSARQQSRLQNAVISNLRASVERAMTEHWFVNAYGGLGQFRSLDRFDPTAGQVQYLAGGSATYRNLEHTIIAAVDRRISDVYGVGASNTLSLSGSWQWMPPRAHVWLSLGFSRTDLQSIILPATTWRGTAEVGRRITGNIAIVGGYAYMGYSNVAINTNGMLGQNAIRIALSWIPRPQAATQP